MCLSSLTTVDIDNRLDSGVAWATNGYNKEPHAIPRGRGMVCIDDGFSLLSRNFQATSFAGKE